jgi:hypothetical protein
MAYASLHDITLKWTGFSPWKMKFACTIQNNVESAGCVTIYSWACSFECSTGHHINSDQPAFGVLLDFVACAFSWDVRPPQSTGIASWKVSEICKQCKKLQNLHTQCNRMLCGCGARIWEGAKSHEWLVHPRMISHPKWNLFLLERWNLHIPCKKMLRVWVVWIYI